MATRKIEARNGTRQPQLWNASGEIERCTKRITSSEMKRPRVAVVWMKLV
jgi:hypothetical protein